MATSKVLAFWKPSDATEEAAKDEHVIAKLGYYRREYDLKMRDLELRCEAEASKIKSDYLAKVLELHQEG